MRGDSRHRDPPLRARTVEEVDELGWAIHDCWIDVEALVPDRPAELEGRIAGFRLPLAFDDDERKRLPPGDDRGRCTAHDRDRVNSLDVSVEARASGLS
jgi:hypothetical protein